MHRLNETRLYIAANKPERSFAPNIGGLDCGAILQNGQQRQDRALGKIGVLEKAACIADHLAELEIDWLEMRIYPRAAGRLQGAEQAIAPQIMIPVCFEHCVRSIRGDRLGYNGNRVLRGSRR